MKNVREYQRDNPKWTIQRNWYTRRIKKKQQKAKRWATRMTQKGVREV
jgi:hypothetical protein